MSSGSLRSYFHHLIVGINPSEHIGHGSARKVLAGHRRLPDEGFAPRATPFLLPCCADDHVGRDEQMADAA